MNYIKKSLKHKITQFLTPIDIVKMAKKSPILWKLFKSTIDLNLIDFYQEFENINAGILERHISILILSAKELFYSNKFDMTTEYYLYCFAIRNKLLFEKDKILPELLKYFDKILNETSPAKIRHYNKYIEIIDKSPEEILKKMQKMTLIKGLTKYEMGTDSLDSLTKEVWDLVKTQPYEITISLSDPRSKICIDKKYITFLFMSSLECNLFNRVEILDLLENYEKIEAEVYNYENYEGPVLNDFLKLTKVKILSIFFSYDLDKLNLENSEVRELHMDKCSADELNGIIENNKSLIFYINSNTEDRMSDDEEETEPLEQIYEKEKIIEKKSDNEIIDKKEQKIEGINQQINEINQSNFDEYGFEEEIEEGFEDGYGDDYNDYDDEYDLEYDYYDYYDEYDLEYEEEILGKLKNLNSIKTKNQINCLTKSNKLIIISLYYKSQYFDINIETDIKYNFYD